MLDKERQFFTEHYKEWLVQNPGKYVLIKDQELIGFFDTQEDALIEGARRFGLDSFLIRRIEESDQIVHIPALTLGILRADSTRPA